MAICKKRKLERTSNNIMSAIKQEEKQEEHGRLKTLDEIGKNEKY